MRRIVVLISILVFVLAATSACSGKGASDSTSGASKVTTAPINSSTDVGAIRGKVDRAAVAADLRTMITNAKVAATTSGGAQPDPQAIYNQTVQQIASKYGIRPADVQDVAKQYGVTP